MARHPSFRPAVSAAVLALAVVFSSGAARAEPMATAKQFLAEVPSDARGAIVQAGSGALRAMGQVLERGSVDRARLRAVVANPDAHPFLSKTLPALGKVDRLPGVDDVLKRLASARDEGGARGASFEIQAGAALGKKLVGLSAIVGGDEWDGRLKDGTVVSMKSLGNANPSTVKGRLKHARKQLQRRTNGKREAMLVIGHQPGQSVSFNMQNMANHLGTKLTVVMIDQSTGVARHVFSAKADPQAAAALAKARLAKAPNAKVAASVVPPKVAAKTFPLRTRLRTKLDRLHTSTRRALSGFNSAMRPRPRRALAFAH